MEREEIIVCRYESPCGELLLGSFGDSLCLCEWLVDRHRDRVCGRLKRILSADLREGMSPVLERAVEQLDEYFAGFRSEFDVPLLFVGTDFQKMVWRELLRIPYGDLISYGEVATRIGRPKSVRAVANANGANAISVFVPCHRVIGTDGSLTGYAGGMAVKEFLLKLEKRS